MYAPKAIQSYEQGLALQQAGKLDEAARVYKKAISAQPNFYEAHNNLGNVQLELGRLKEATRAYRSALQWLPDHPLLLNNLGNALQLGGRNEQALEYLDKALAIQDEYADAHCNRGNALHALSRQEEAVKAYRSAIKIDPSLADAHNNLGNVLSELEQTDEAIISFKKACEINPAHRDAYHGLGNALRMRQHLDEAIAVYHRAVEIDPRNADSYCSLGQCFIEQQEYDLAIETFQKAIAIDSKYVSAYYGLGRSLGIMGEKEAAIEVIRKLMQHDPAEMKAIAVIAANKKFVSYDDDIKAMEALYVDEAITDKTKSRVVFHLGRAYEDIGEYEKSIKMIAEGTEFKRSSFEYSTAESKLSFERIKSRFEEQFIESTRARGIADSSPIFILGMPRSGTTLTEQILSSHPDVFGAGELAYIGDLAFKLMPDEADTKIITPVSLTDQQIKSMGETYIERLRSHSSTHRFITDKMPHNFIHIGLIKAILPQSKIIHLQRNSIDNCLSIFKTHFSKGHHYSYHQSELGEYYKLYQDLMNHWQSLLGEQIFNLKYEELTESPEATIRALLNFCELPWNDACLSFNENRRPVKTASMAQVRRPMYRDAVGRWKHYEAALQPLIKALSD